MRSIAKVLLSVGAVILIYCCCIMARAQLYQAYEDWTFDRILRKSGTSVEPPPDSPLRLDGEHRHPAPKLYSLIGRIEIPRLGLSTMILEGDEERELLLGAGHVPGTALPGEAGNVGIAAHRDTFFRPLKRISQNDEIRLTTRGGSFRYLVDSVEITDQNNVAVLQASTGPTVTLITCYPFSFVGPAPKRFIVHAKEIAVH